MSYFHFHSLTEPATSFSATSMNPAAPSILLLSQHIPKNSLSVEGIIVEALFMTVVTTDIVLAKMAKRDLLCIFAKVVYVVVVIFIQELGLLQFLQEEVEEYQCILTRAGRDLLYFRKRVAALFSRF